ncbi:SAM-dependent methyltransferase [Micromonospora sp. CPCC 206061]|uniref:SAM-dependent methyltransferase n=1 Tax=Micromonospora sp. CPCC 206061 TaxID=3122410 RepID=UPI002FF3FB71
MVETAASLPGVDTTVPSPARMYDYFLGGVHSFPVDQAAAEKVLENWPLTGQICKANRGFLHRAVRFLAAERGIRQFVDLGSGIPTMGNVHEIAQQAAPDARVLYVDIDPVAVMHSHQLLADNDLADAMPGDLNDPTAVLEQLESNPLIDLSRPVGLVMACLLHFLDDQHAYEAVARMVDALTPGSYLVLTHATVTDFNQAAAKSVTKVYQQTTTNVHIRTRDQIMRFLNGLDTLAPGLVWTPEWQPYGTPADTEAEFAPNPALSGIYAAVASVPWRP